MHNLDKIFYKNNWNVIFLPPLGNITGLGGYTGTVEKQQNFFLSLELWGGGRGNVLEVLNHFGLPFLRKNEQLKASQIRVFHFQFKTQIVWFHSR